VELKKQIILKGTYGFAVFREAELTPNNHRIDGCSLEEIA